MGTSTKPGHRSLQRWSRIHRCASLICTAFLLMLCVTGLPLIFVDEIQRAADTSAAYPELPADTSNVDIDTLMAIARRAYPDQVITGIFIDPQEPQVRVYMAPSHALAAEDPKRVHWLKFDARDGRLLGESRPSAQMLPSVMRTVFALHANLLVGLPGTLVLGVMGLLFLVALVSGVVLYGPFTRKLPFGTVRRARASRLRWLDLHNLLGVTTVVWALVVGFTGALNELSTPLFALWQRTEVQALLEPWQKEAPPPARALVPLQPGLDKVRAALPDMVVTGIDPPGSLYGTPHHYMLWARGSSLLTSRLLSPALVDAGTGELTAIVRMPWYLRAIEIARPLHFGDYGGLPLKILWALLDVATIIVLGSGIYLWVSRRPRQGPDSRASK
jgi:uncharacterized iron-regulated membrane protein